MKEKIILGEYDFLLGSKRKGSILINGLSLNEEKSTVFFDYHRIPEEDYNFDNESWNEENNF